MAMQMYVTHDRARVDHGRRRIESDYWPMVLPLGGECGLLFRKVTTGRDSIVQWSSRLLRRGIHVSPMSGTWLRTHEAEHTKHRVDI